MKVLHVIPSLARVRGGPSEAVLGMVKGLRSYQIDAEIATTNDNGTHLLDVPLDRRIEYEGVPVWFFHRFSPPLRPLGEYAFSAGFTRWLWRHIKDYDLLHIHAIFSYPSTAAMLIARNQGIPYVIKTLGQLSEWSLKQSAWRKYLYLRCFEQANLQNSRFVLFTSEQEQREATKGQAGVSNAVFPMGVSMPSLIPEARQKLRQFLALPPDEPVLLFLSRWHIKKGLEYLIPALGQIKQRRFAFVMVGDGEASYKRRIHELLQQHGISDRTHDVGFIQREEKQLFLQGADLLVLTSHSENFGMSVLEALSVGLPVLVTHGVALASIVERYRVGYVTDLKVPAIALALEAFLSQIDHQDQMRHRARHVVSEHFTWQRLLPKLIQMYHSILNPESMVSIR